ncbi:MAG: helix-hairpin-helix domain-containing protein, partial [Aeromicrobium sp.]
ALLKVFGSVKKLRAASAEEIALVPGIGLATAQSIVESLTSNNGDRAPSVNMMTGEILED